MNAICAQLLDLAKRQIGYKEEYINCTKYSRFFDVEAWKWFNTKKNGNPAKKVAGTEWCAIFICWLFAQAETLGPKQALSFLGCPAPKNNCAAGCGYLYDYMKAKGYKSDIKNVKPGDIVFFKSGSKCSHVGIAESVSNGKVITIEGNKDNQVKRVTHNISSNIYFGVMSPDWSKAHFYKQQEAPAPAPIPEAPKPEVPSTYQMKVTTKVDPLRLRSYASCVAPVICLMKKGSIVTYLGSASGDWLKVKYKTMIGYAHKSYLTKV